MWIVGDYHVLLTYFYALFATVPLGTRCLAVVRLLSDGTISAVQLCLVSQRTPSVVIHRPLPVQRSHGDWRILYMSSNTHAQGAPSDSGGICVDIPDGVARGLAERGRGELDGASEGISLTASGMLTGESLPWLIVPRSLAHFAVKLLYISTRHLMHVIVCGAAAPPIRRVWPE